MVERFPLGRFNLNSAMDPYSLTGRHETLYQGYDKNIYDVPSPKQPKSSYVKHLEQHGYIYEDEPVATANRKSAKPRTCGHVSGDDQKQPAWICSMPRCGKTFCGTCVGHAFTSLEAARAMPTKCPRCLVKMSPFWTDAHSYKMAGLFTVKKTEVSRIPMKESKTEILSKWDIREELPPPAEGTENVNPWEEDEEEEEDLWDTDDDSEEEEGSEEEEDSEDERTEEEDE